MTDVSDLYQQLILDHHRNPRNAGRLDRATHAAELHNPLCGDRLTLTLEVSGGVVRSARCDVQGCALCRASGSLMTEAIIGRGGSELQALAARLSSAVAGTGPAAASPAAEAEGLGPLAALAHVRHFPSRTRCVTLPWEALKLAIGQAPDSPPEG